MIRSRRPVEVLQTTALDCGPAALASLLRGIGVSADYAALRDLCGTDIDGTSIDALEDVGRVFGGDLEQIVTPIEQALAAPEEHLPAIVVTALPDGFLHFVVVWRRRGPFLEIMDPAVGRRWIRTTQLGSELYRHEALVDADAWADWVTSAEFVEPLRRRLRHVGLAGVEVEALLAEADRDAWTIARVDAACRATESVLQATSGRGRRAARLLHALLSPATDALADEFWSARPGEAEEQVALRGAVLLRAVGRLEVIDRAQGAVVSALGRRTLTQAMLDAARRTPYLAAAATCTAVVAAGLEVGLFFAMRPLTGNRSNGASTAVILLVLAGIATGVGYAAAARMGRAMEAELRAAVRQVVPRLPDSYFRTRPASDTVERVHLVHRISELPGHVWRMLTSGTQMLLAVVALTLLVPADWPLVLMLAVVSTVVPLAMAPILAERDLRLRTSSGVLSHYLIDGLLGATALRAHRGAAAFRARHEQTLNEWQTAHQSMARASAVYLALADGAGFAVAGLLIYVSTPGLPVGTALLVAVLALGIPVLGTDLGVSVRATPAYRSLLARLSDPLSAGLEPLPAEDGVADAVQIDLDNVSASLGGVATLTEVTLHLAAGSHVAVVGPSGAGKSTLLSVLLGWVEPADGRILLDGLPAEAADLVALRRTAAWVSPSVALWDRTLAENLAPATVTASDIVDVRSPLDGQPEQRLGTGGSRLSGGQAQRIRIARALGRPSARLVLLDEPCRGLEAVTRTRLLADMRRRWAASTLLCVTHDIEETRQFPRVLVIDGGRLVEDGSPAELLGRSGSRYAELIQAHRLTAARTWGSNRWRELHVDDGCLSAQRQGR